MSAFLKTILDRTTMYRLVLYYLLALLVVAAAVGAYGGIPYTPTAIVYSAAVLTVAAWVTNVLFARLFGAVTNLESAIITALILALILPPVGVGDAPGSVGLILVATTAMASKYAISFGGKHLFNPAAFAAAFSAFVLGTSATWWVAGNIALMPIVVLGGIAIVYKLRRFDLIGAFASAAFVTIAFTSSDPITDLQATILHSAFFFLAFAMLTEPLTMPPTRRLRLVYGAIVGVLFAPAAHLGSFYFSPETALLAGNLFSYFVSPKGRYILSLVERRKLARGIYEFGFRSDRPFSFLPGQYLEWTLSGVPFDSRGNRRYFTIASAPHEDIMRLGMRIPDTPSAFKEALASLPRGGHIHVASLAGDFTPPDDPARKLAFIAGGIGVTPFASMVRHFIGSGESRDMVLLYASRTAEEIAYRDIFALAAKQGLRTVYALTSPDARAFPGARVGTIDATFISREIPDYRERTFYLSGPPGMVSGMKRALLDLGVSRFSIKTDYFPGLA